MTEPHRLGSIFVDFTDERLGQLTKLKKLQAFAMTFKIKSFKFGGFAKLRNLTILNLFSSFTTFTDDYSNDLIAYAKAHPKRAIKIDLFSGAYKPIAPNFKIVESSVNLPPNVSVKQFSLMRKYTEDNLWD